MSNCSVSQRGWERRDWSRPTRGKFKTCLPARHDMDRCAFTYTHYQTLFLSSGESSRVKHKRPATRQAIPARTGVSARRSSRELGDGSRGLHRAAASACRSASYDGLQSIQRAEAKRWVRVCVNSLPPLRRVAQEALLILTCATHASVLITFSSGLTRSLRWELRFTVFVFHENRNHAATEWWPAQSACQGHIQERECSSDTTLSNKKPCTRGCLRQKKMET